MGYCRLFFFLSHILLNFVCLTITQPDFLFHFCGDMGTSNVYESNKNTLLSSLPASIDTNGFYNSSFGQNSDRINAIVLCRGDVEFDVCHSCVDNGTRRLLQLCLNYKGAIGWYDYCMVRYSNKSIFQTLNTGPNISEWGITSNSDMAQFNLALTALFSRLKRQATSDDSLRKFATGNESIPNSQTLYALLECTPDLSEQQCNICLDVIAAEIPQCCNTRREGRILRPSCTLRFDTSRFYNDIVARVPPGKDNGTTRTIVIIIVPTLIISVILIVTVCIFVTRRKHRKPKEKIGETMDEISSIETLQYNFETIRIATDNFSSTNKLGHGGFGAVYKGRLLNGKEIAVKRLSRDSEQGEQEFKNEVLLVIKLQHRNLVKLLGFCLEGIERVLIYEFVPNGSLDHFIFDPIKRADLDLDIRYKIIRGIARGLLYLHEDSRLRIIHRDLKASNILLDSKMNPKIADFGMARLFVLDETQGNTRRIAGTYGYMAPEYAMHGHFSTKSDVFSFGVLVLEVVSGQRNSYFQHEENVEDLLSCAWKHWRDGTTSNLIDPKLRSGSSSVEDIMRCIHIGLLCVQGQLADRPTMASVVLMLNSSTFTLPVPLESAYLTHSRYNPERPLPQNYDPGMTHSSQSKSKSVGLSIKEEDSITELYPP